MGKGTNTDRVLTGAREMMEQAEETVPKVNFVVQDAYSIYTRMIGGVTLFIRLRSGGIMVGTLSKNKVTLSVGHGTTIKEVIANTLGDLLLFVLEEADRSELMLAKTKSLGYVLWNKREDSPSMTTALRDEELSFGDPGVLYGTGKNVKAEKKKAAKRTVKSSK